MIQPIAKLICKPRSVPYNSIYCWPVFKITHQMKYLDVRLDTPRQASSFAAGVGLYSTVHMLASTKQHARGGKVCLQAEIDKHWHITQLLSKWQTVVKSINETNNKPLSEIINMIETNFYNKHFLWLRVHDFVLLVAVAMITTFTICLNVGMFSTFPLLNCNRHIRILPGRRLLFQFYLQELQRDQI